MVTIAVICGAGQTKADIPCNPVVSPAQHETSLARLLERLSVSYDFDLIMPDGFDKVVEVKKSMRLEQLIQELISGMNTILRHENIEGCASARLIELTIMSTGEDSEYLNKGLPVDILRKIPLPEKSH